jgi:PAS domain S-box-containing protein
VRSPLRILVLEDDPTDAALIQELLEADDITCEVTCVQTRTDYLSSLEDPSINLILADYTLPSFDGLSALKLAQKLRPDLPFIFVSGTLGEEVAIEALKIGATDYVLKSRLSRLAPSVERALREAGDRTQRKRAEEALRRSEMYLAEAQRLSHTGSFGWDVLTGEIYWSDETYRIFDIEPTTKPTVQTVIDRTHPDDQLNLRQVIERAALERRSFSAEHRLTMPDGLVKHVRVVARRAACEDSERVLFIGAVTDITARDELEMKVAERTAELRRSEAYLAEAQRLSHTGTWVFDSTTGLYTYWSDESYRIWGLDPLQGLPNREIVWQRVHPDDRNRLSEEVQEVLRQKKDYEGEFRIVLPDGTVKYLAATSYHTFSADGEILERFGTHVDVTERTRALARLEQMQSDFAHINRVSMMGELAASLSHEITQPIASARNNARAALNFLDRQPPELGEVREALACVVGDADRAGEIIDGIRDHIKKAPPRKGHFDLNEAINEVIVLGRSAIIKNAVWVQTRLSGGLFPVHGDRVQLQQVVLNLLLNAVEAMGSREVGAREMLISTEQDHRGVLVAVRDSGPGIDPSHLERVFDTFYTTKSSGMGMGLSICRSIVSAHGGRLWAEANELGGAIFQFTLPAVQLGS